jgi:putative MATE family efflux protein
MAKNKELIRDLTTGSVPGTMLRFAMPLFLSGLLQMVYNMVDMIVVGQMVGTKGLSAVSIGGEMMMLITFIAMGFSNAGQVIISQYLGARQRESISRFVAVLFSFLLFCALALGLLFFLLRVPLLRIMNTPAEAWTEAYHYMTICLCGLVFIFGYNASSAVLRGLGDSRHPFLFIGIASVSNVLLDLLFVMGLGMGAGGAALATVISQAFSFVCCAVLVIRRRDLFGISFSLSDFLKSDPILLEKLLKLGIPMALKSMSVQVSKLFVNSFVNSYGVAVSAFAGIANKIAIISNMLSSALNTSGSTMIGQNLGARKTDRCTKTIWGTLVCTMILATITSLVGLIFSDALYGVFTKDAEVVAMGRVFMQIMVATFYCGALMGPFFAMVNGSGFASMGFFIGILDVIFRVGISLLFEMLFHLGVYSYWWGNALCRVGPMIICMIYYFSGKWKTRKLLTEMSGKKG